MKLFKYKSSSVKGRRGAILLFVMVVLIVIISVVGSYLGFVQISTKSTGAQITDSQAIYLAEAGVHYGIYNLKQDNTWTGTGSAVSFGKGDFSVSVTALGGGEFRLISTGTVNNQSHTVQQDVNDSIIPKDNTWRETE
jgi:Tfp pilus assembly protein PilX